MIWAARYSRSPYPPTGRYSYPDRLTITFKRNAIPDDFRASDYHLRPRGMHSPQAESAILGRIRAVVDGRTRAGDVENL